MKSIKALYREHLAKYGDEKIRVRARQDAGRDIPIQRIEVSSPYEMELYRANQILASKIAAEYQKRLEEIDSQIKMKIISAEREFENEQKRIAEAYRVKKEAIEDPYELKLARMRLERVNQRFEEIYKRVGRIPKNYFPPWFQIPFVGFILGFAFVMNALVFPAFKTNPALDWATSALLAMWICLSGHFAGTRIRERPERGSYTANFALAIGVLTVLIAVLFWRSGLHASGLQALVEVFTSPKSLGNYGILFFVSNVSVLLLVTFISALACDSEPGYQQIYREYRKVERTAVLEEESYRLNNQTIELDRVAEMDAARKSLLRAIETVNDMKADYDQLLREGQGEEKRVLHQLGRQLSVYRHENISNRRDRRVPICFNNILEFPMILERIKIKLR